MDNWIFKKLYDDKGNEDGGHIVRNSGKVVQVCLHKYITRTIGIDELDISALSFLLRHLATLSTNETTALDTITTYRGLICHAQSSNCYDKASLNIIWTGLENALVELTDPSYKRLTKKQIKCLRKVHLEKEEIQELLKTVEESIEEVTKLLSSNNNVIEKCELNLKKTVVEESLAMQHRLEDESSSIKQTQQVVIQEVLSSKAAAQESGNKILEQIEMLNRNQASIFTAMSDQREMIMKMVHPINGTTFSIKCEQSTDLSDGSKVCFLLWQLATPEHWNAAEVEQILTKCEDMFKDLPIKIKFVRKGSLVIMTTVAVEVLKNSPAFQSAIKSFLTRMVEVCNINTHVNCDVDVTLHVLNINELNCKPSNIPTENKVVQTEDTDYEHQMRMTKHWNESEIFDLAFLNSDNQTEIEWIQNVSSMLKAKYDIKCAIPSKDYLYGLPLKDELLQYLNKFPAVVLTVTKENHHFYQPYFDDKTPLIVVELDYISEIPRKLWTFPYINCTTCEHLWVPQLINTLKTKLPSE
ncbi:unnamed protein product [Mytilus edulis]|uniref:Uncharacterized protein n=1 Tax=Mytilus edulis TaxID=6550 RepID=A0A8S3T518_MYTED|nr:unnamed protein product [Mytilus edulis]